MQMCFVQLAILHADILLLFFCELKIKTKSEKREKREKQEKTLTINPENIQYELKEKNSEFLFKIVFLIFFFLHFFIFVRSTIKNQ